jgi:hypothetical protein
VRPAVPDAPAVADPGWREAGIGVAFGLALRYLVPRLLRRL